MRVQCPDCTIAYDVPDHLLVGHRVLRCARCGAEWTPGQPAAKPEEATPVQSPPPLPAALPPLAAPAPLPDQHEAQLEREPFSAMQRLALPVEPPRRTPWVGLAWVGSLIVVAALAWGAVTWRADVMHAWPPSTRAYAALGLAPTSP